MGYSESYIRVRPMCTNLTWKNTSLLCFQYYVIGYCCSLDCFYDVIFLYSVEICSLIPLVCVIYRPLPFLQYNVKQLGVMNSTLLKPQTSHRIMWILWYLQIICRFLRYIFYKPTLCLCSFLILFHLYLKNIHQHTCNIMLNKKARKSTICAFSQPVYI